MSIGIGLIGYGYWGPNLARNFSESRQFDLRRIVDLSPAKREKAAIKYSHIEIGDSFESLLSDPTIQAVAIATPTTSHFKLAKEALEAGKHVLVEKPLTQTAAQSRELVALAQKQGLCLMVDHTFIYTPPVRYMQKMITNGDLGDVYYYDSMRINLGLFQQDVDVIWDLAVHDISILKYLLNAHPISVSATGLSHIPGAPENIAYITLHMPNNIIAHINVNWLAPVKIRRTILGGSKKMVIFDDFEPTEKIRIYDKGITLTADTTDLEKIRVGYRMGDIVIPQIENKEALSAMIEHFAHCIQTREEPETSGRLGLEIVEILEAATQSMRNNGLPVALANPENMRRD